MSSLREETLRYQAAGRPGKIAIQITKACATQHDLSLAYTPGVAEPVRAIHADPATAYAYTARGNLVAVITNGTAVLGLGDVGALAAKPVMEGKALLFKRFADVDVFDIEINATDPDDVVRIVKALEPTFGGINLEDIKAPECFFIEERLKTLLDIPVFHDDQHGTAIITGAGAAAIACGVFLVRLAMPRTHILLVDTRGVVHKDRTAGMNPYKERFAADTSARTLADALSGADVFIGLSVGGIVSPAMVQSMAPAPIVFALANPDPEIGFDDARAARVDVIVATGRSDYPNQVNNVLGFPFIFRGALDVRARAITDEMKIAAAKALAALAKEDVPDAVLRAYALRALRFGPDYLIPKPLDPRLPIRVAPAVAQAAMAAGVARKTIDLNAYRGELARRLTRMSEDVKETARVMA